MHQRDPARLVAGSLFSGVGGLDLGLHRAGIRHAFFCESDPWRRTVLAHHWPGVPIYDDVRAVGKPEGGGLLTDIAHQLTAGGGKPGQGYSAVAFLAKTSPSPETAPAPGARSGLFHEYARIADALRPRWLLIENVPGLLSSNSGRDFGIVLGTLADIGYGLAWRIVDSRFFGVPQRRRRVFIVGALADGDPRAAAQRAGEILAVGTRCDRHPATRTEAGPNTAGALGGVPPGGGWRIGADEAAVNHLVAGTLGGGAGERGWAQDVERMTFVSHALTKGGRLGDSTEETFVSFHATQDPIHHHHHHAPPVGHEANGVANASGVRRLTPVECERLQAWPDNWTDPTGNAPDSRRYAAAGDGVTATVSEWIGRRLLAAHNPDTELGQPTKETERSAL